MKKALIGLLTLQSVVTFAATNNCKNSKEVILNDSIVMKFCEIPAGSSLIGSNHDEPDEKPVTKRNFKNFQMGQFTVTQQQYKAVLNEEPWKENGKLMPFVEEGDNFPAVYVSYNQAKQFARVMNLIDSSFEYRLPTEAEFEYATRADTTTEYYWGEEFDPSYVYFWDNAGSGSMKQRARDVRTCPVTASDRYPDYCANGFGLMHMLGNVMQWTADAYVDSYANAPTNGNVPVAGEASSNRVIRGQSFVTLERDIRTANRGYTVPDHRVSDLGFRLVRTTK